MAFNISWGSCENRFQYAYGGYIVVNQLNSKAFWRLDDMPYVNQGSTCWGTTTTGVDKDSVLADFQAIYDQSDSNPGMVAIDASVPNRFRVAGDHGVGGNDWDHTYTTSERDTPIGTTNDLAGEVERNAHWAVGMQAFLANDLDNPAYTLAAEVPSGASLAGDTPTSSNYVPRYFKVGFDRNGNRNDSSPFVECFTLDCITSRDPLTPATRTAMSLADADAVMIGALQEAQLLADLAASSATFKLIFSAKKLFKNVLTDNGDIWGAIGGANPNGGYETQRDRILAAIDAASGWAVPGGVVWLSGDRHLACVDVKTKAGGDTWDVVNVTTATWNKPAVTGTQDDVTTRFLDTTHYTFGNVKVLSDRIIIQILNALDGKVLWSGTVKAGENKLSNDIEVSI